jgi:hypothetical protein
MRTEVTGEGYTGERCQRFRKPAFRFFIGEGNMLPYAVKEFRGGNTCYPKPDDEYVVR